MYNIDKSRRDIYWEKIENKCKNLKEGPFMHSVKTRITAMTICIIVLASISIVMGMVAIRHIENYDADQTLLLLCETGQKDLNYYFQNAEQSIKSVAAFVESDIDWDTLDVDLLHIGYILLLDALDEPDSIYGTKWPACCTQPSSGASKPL